MSNYDQCIYPSDVFYLIVVSTNSRKVIHWHLQLFRLAIVARIYGTYLCVSEVVVKHEFLFLSIFKFASYNNPIIRNWCSVFELEVVMCLMHEGPLQTQAQNEAVSAVSWVRSLINGELGSLLCIEKWPGFSEFPYSTFGKLAESSVGGEAVCGTMVHICLLGTRSAAFWSLRKLVDGIGFFKTHKKSSSSSLSTFLLICFSCSEALFLVWSLFRFVMSLFAYYGNVSITLFLLQSSASLNTIGLPPKTAVSVLNMLFNCMLIYQINCPTFSQTVIALPLCFHPLIYDGSSWIPSFLWLLKHNFLLLTVEEKGYLEGFEYWEGLPIL
jgi:hypothetical protein